MNPDRFPMTLTESERALIRKWLLEVEADASFGQGLDSHWREQAFVELHRRLDSK